MRRNSVELSLVFVPCVLELFDITINTTSRGSYYLIEYAYGILSATSKVTLAVLLILLIRARNDTVKLEFDYVQSLGLDSTGTYLTK
jgi:hypothetical protein